MRLTRPAASTPLFARVITVKIKVAILMAASCIVSSEAAAETSDPLWTVSASASWSEIDAADRDALSGSLSLSRFVGKGSVGVALATSNGSDALFEQSEITERTSFFASAWIVFPVGAADMDLSVSYGQEDFDGRLALDSLRFENLDNAEVDLASEVDSFAIAAAVSRTYIAGDWDFIPRASLGWSRSEATSTAAAIDGPVRPAVLNEEQSGATATAGLGIGYVAHDRIYLFSDVSGLFAENGAATSVGQASRVGGLRASTRQDPDEAIWSEVSLGATFFATDTVTLGLAGGGTAGRDQEEVFATTTLSVGF